MSAPAGAALLVISNGLGEDTIAAGIVRALRAQGYDGAVDAFPLVGTGAPLRALDCRLIEAFNLLPGEGFSTLSAGALWRDLRAGWISTHYRQWRTARGLRGRYRLALAVGDIVPMVAARAARLPFVFVGCARSALYSGPPYLPWELRLLRRRAVAVYPRDAPTARFLARAGVEVTGVGNGMLDLLEPAGPRPTDLDLRPPVVAVLPGSRRDALERIDELLALIACAEQAGGPSGRASYAFALAGALSPAAVAERVRRCCGRHPAWRIGAQAPRRIEIQGASARILLIWGAFPAVLRASRLALGLAGTANEQAAGLGLPLVTYATAGVYGPAYVRMKKHLFGEAQWVTDGSPGQTCAALDRLLTDDDQCRHMGAVGIARMGRPGVTAAVAQRIRHLLDQTVTR